MAESAFIPRIAALHELQSIFLEPKLRKLGISLNTFQLLTAIHAAGASASQVEIARRLGISPATLSETVQVHIRRGLLDQAPSTTDRRVKILRLTKSSSSKLKEVVRLLDELEAEMLRGISPSALRQAMAVLDQVIENVENFSKS